MTPERKGRLFVVMASSRPEYESCRTLTVLPSPVFANKAHAMLDDGEVSTARMERNVV